MKRDLRYYRSLPYARQRQFYFEGESRYWLAWIRELEGCIAEGSTEDEAFANLEETFDDYIAAKLDWKSPILEPQRWTGKPHRTKRKKQDVEIMIVQPSIEVADVLFGPSEPIVERETVGNLVPA